VLSKSSRPTPTKVAPDSFTIRLRTSRHASTTMFAQR
jgi:hypothetical protein